MEKPVAFPAPVAGGSGAGLDEERPILPDVDHHDGVSRWAPDTVYAVATRQSGTAGRMIRVFCPMIGWAPSP